MFLVQGGLQAGAAADRAALLHPVGGGEPWSSSCLLSPLEHRSESRSYSILTLKKQNSGYFCQLIIVLYRILAFVNIVTRYIVFLVRLLRYPLSHYAPQLKCELEDQVMEHTYSVVWSKGSKVESCTYNWIRWLVFRWPWSWQLRFNVWGLSSASRGSSLRCYRCVLSCTYILYTHSVTDLGSGAFLPLDPGFGISIPGHN